MHKMSKEVRALMLDKILASVRKERTNQDEKWNGDNNIVFRSRADGLAVLTEEVGEAACSHLEGDEESFFNEMIQVAAVAVAICEAVGLKMWDEIMERSAGTEGKDG